MRTSLRFALIVVASTVLFAACGTSPIDDPLRHSRGNENAAVTLVEYGDLECPACKSTHELIMAPIVEQYGSRVRFVFRQFPLTEIHEFALEAAMASECAGDQGKFWEFLDIAYKNQVQLSSQALRDWGNTLGLISANFDQCISSGEKKAVIDGDIAEATRLQIQGTPTFFLNGEKLSVQTINDMRTALDRALSVPL
jgi:protein-disulfide isomerase